MRLLGLLGYWGSWTIGAIGLSIGLLGLLDYWRYWGYFLEALRVVFVVAPAILVPRKSNFVKMITEKHRLIVNKKETRAEEG